MPDQSTSLSADVAKISAIDDIRAILADTRNTSDDIANKVRFVIERLGASATYNDPRGSGEGRISETAARQYPPYSPNPAPWGCV